MEHSSTVINFKYKPGVQTLFADGSSVNPFPL